MRISGPVDPRRAAPRSAWSTAWIPRPSRASPRTGEAAFGYAVPNLLIDHAMRNPHITPGFWRGVNINQNAHLSSNASWMSWRMPPAQDPLAFRRKLMAQPSEAPRRAQCRRRKDRLGQAGAAGRLSRPRAERWAMAATSRRRRKSRSSTAARSRCTASSPPPIPAMPSIRRRSSARSPARSSTG